MGCCTSKPGSADGGSGGSGTASKRTPAATQSSLLAQRRQSAQDPGLSETHEYVKPLGRGGTGEICHFRDQKTGENVAIKLIKRPVPRVVATSLLREILIQAELGEGHVNVVEVREVLLTQRHLCLVMELAGGGTLTHHVIDRHTRSQAIGATGVSEDEARYFFRQFIDAVAFCHVNNVAHRDLKLDNTLLDDSQPPRVKLCDFGFAKAFDKGDNMFTNIGTPAYMSPAQLHRRSDKDGYSGMAVDVWAAGVLLTVMLLGEFPYDHVENEDPNTLAARMEVWSQQVQTAWHDVPSIARVVERLTPACRDLLNRIFVMDEDQRITIAQIREHPWFTQPPAPALSVAAARLAVEQHRLEQYLEARSIDKDKKSERAARVEDLIAQAGLRPPLCEFPLRTPEVTIDLREAAILQHNSPRIGDISGRGSAQSAARFQEALAHLEEVEAIHAMEHAQHASRPAQDGTVSDTAPVGCPPGATGANDVSRQQAGQHQVAKRPKGSEADGGGGVPVCASAATASTLSSHEAVEGGL